MAVQKVQSKLRQKPPVAATGRPTTAGGGVDGDQAVQTARIAEPRVGAVAGTSKGAIRRSRGATHAAAAGVRKSTRHRP